MISAFKERFAVHVRKFANLSFLLNVQHLYFVLFFKPLTFRWINDTIFFLFLELYCFQACSILQSLSWSMVLNKDCLICSFYCALKTKLRMFCVCKCLLKWKYFMCCYAKLWVAVCFQFWVWSGLCSQTASQHCCSLGRWVGFRSSCLHAQA